MHSLRQIKQESEVRDLETGEPLFQPRVGRPPKSGVLSALNFNSLSFNREITEVSQLENICLTSSIRLLIPREDCMRTMLETLHQREHDLMSIHR